MDPIGLGSTMVGYIYIYILLLLLYVLYLFFFECFCAPTRRNGAFSEFLNKGLEDQDI